MTYQLEKLQLRHPEKAWKPDNLVLRKPDWIRVKAPVSHEYRKTHKLMRELNLNTVCEEASCPNIGECWSKGHATVMILGSVCTRACSFCNVATGKAEAVDNNEPINIALAVNKLQLKHVVVTSVDRDDLADGGASHFADVILKVRDLSPETSIEVLTPDFIRQPNAISIVVDAAPDVYNHNLETVQRLYGQVRPGARYDHSLFLLQRVKELNPAMFTKSGIMVGLGESKAEVFQAMNDLRSANVDFLTIGQYLQPTPKHISVDRFVTPSEFEEYADLALDRGFLLVASSPLTRSSYHAEDAFNELRRRRAMRIA